MTKKHLLSTPLVMLILFISHSPAYGAITANSIWEVRPSIGSNLNGSCFSLGVGTAATGTDAVIDGTLNTKFTSASHGTLASNVGQWIKFTSGTGFTTGYYQIVSSSSTAAILDRPLGTLSSTGGNYSLYPGIDRSQQNTAQKVIDNSAITATTAAANSNVMSFTAGYTPSEADVGNCVHLASGTNINPGWYEITSESHTTCPTTACSWTLTGAQNATTATAAGSAIVGKMGGAADLIETITGVQIASGNQIFVKAGTYATAGITLSASNSVTNASPMTRVQCYTTTRNDGGICTITPSTSGVTGMTVTGAGYHIKGFNFDGSGPNAWVSGIVLSNISQIVENVTVNTFTTYGIRSTGAGVTVINNVIENGQSGCLGGISGHLSSGVGMTVMQNKLKNNACNGSTGAAIQMQQGGDLGSSIAWNLVFGTTGVGIQVDKGTLVVNNTVDGSSGAGIQGASSSGASGTIVKNNLLTNNAIATQPWTSVGWPASIGWDGNCLYNNTANMVNGADEGITSPPNGASPYRNTLDVILLSSPYVDPTHASDNYSILNTSSAYQSAQPGAMPGESQLGYMTCGAFIPQASTGGNAASSFVQ